ncbi:hypothetical protein J6590_077046 [Homalodisca vitripennis]|nr:hypothetical protein J6590_077046 [Homalodisca vitripennis]
MISIEGKVEKLESKVGAMLVSRSLWTMTGFISDTEQPTNQFVPTDSSITYQSVYSESTIGLTLPDKYTDDMFSGIDIPVVTFNYTRFSDPCVPVEISSEVLTYNPFVIGSLNNPDYLMKHDVSSNCRRAMQKRFLNMHGYNLKALMQFQIQSNLSENNARLVPEAAQKLEMESYFSVSFVIVEPSDKMHFGFISNGVPIGDLADVINNTVDIRFNYKTVKWYSSSKVQFIMPTGFDYVVVVLRKKGRIQGWWNTADISVKITLQFITAFNHSRWNTYIMEHVIPAGEWNVCRCRQHTSCIPINPARAVSGTWDHVSNKRKIMVACKVGFTGEDFT